MKSSYLIAQLRQLIALKLDQLLTLDAMKMIVRRIAVVVLIDASSIQLEAPQ